MKTTPIVTISLPCYLRPQRTIRAIECIMSQNISGWELLITGDCCPYFNKNEFTTFLDACKHQAAEKGNSIISDNNFQHSGNWGAEIRSFHIQEATGTWFIFMGNDDIIFDNHLKERLKFVEGTNLDFAYFDTWVSPYNAPRNAQLQFGMIGHSELICRTSFLKQMPPHSNQYGHDWELITNMVNAGGKHEKARGYQPTYVVMSVPGNEEKGID